MPDELRNGLSQVAIGGAELGEALCDDRRVPLVSATGSTRMGRAVGPRDDERRPTKPSWTERVAKWGLVV